ncbi:hypothetical protein B0H11DRAFT_2084244, partial [Mycena galericulata]
MTRRHFILSLFLSPVIWCNGRPLKESESGVYGSGMGAVTDLRGRYHGFNISEGNIQAEASYKISGRNPSYTD